MLRGLAGKGTFYRARGLQSPARSALTRIHNWLFLLFYFWRPGTESNCRHGDFQTLVAFSGLPVFNNLRTPAPRQVATSGQERTRDDRSRSRFGHAAIPLTGKNVHSIILPVRLYTKAHHNDRDRNHQDVFERPGRHS